MAEPRGILPPVSPVPPPDNVPNRVRYFTARVRAWPNDPSQPERQDIFLRATATLPEVSIHYGKFKVSNHWMKLVSPYIDDLDLVLVERSEEKGSDVSLAAHLLADGFQDDYDVAVVVTNDPDQRDSIRIVRHQIGKKVLVLFPLCGGRHGSNVLKSVAHAHFNVDESVLAASQLPPLVTTARGRQLRKPKSW